MKAGWGMQLEEDEKEEEAMHCTALHWSDRDGA